ncbi:MAG: DNA-processing protein DprA [Clostridia bacterium]|nr:DNA-processing protein DprA [Clostridia bacterium]
MKNDLYWLWLSECMGVGAPVFDVIAYFSGAKQLYEAGENQWRASGLFSHANLLKMLRSTPEKMEKICRICRENSIEIVTYEDENYPESLKRIDNFPLVLFVQGDISCLKDRIAIAVVGTRKPSLYGIEAATKIVGELADEKAVIVSGGALGIDSIAHLAAIEKGSKTVLVMGCGHLASYLSENEYLRKKVVENGALISEYSPTTPATVYNFPKRNRIVSALSRGVLVVEAGEKSGTMNTVSHARHQGKDVFAVPGDVNSVAYSGSNKIIREGARAVFSGNDILAYYKMIIPQKNEKHFYQVEFPFEGITEFPYGEKEIKAPKNRTSKPKIEEKTETKQEFIEENQKNTEIFEKNISESVSDNAKLVYNQMSGEIMSFDEITRLSKLPPNKVLVALTELEMAGAIKAAGSGNYCKNA